MISFELTTDFVAFAFEARKQDPLASKVDYRYYERLNATYKAQRDQELTLDRWLKNGLDIQCIYSFTNWSKHFGTWVPRPRSGRSQKEMLQGPLVGKVL